MVGILNRVGMLVTTTGQGTVTASTLISNKFLTPAEAGAINGQKYFWMLEEGSDFELFIGTWTLSGTTVSRDTVISSKIGGTAGTTKLTLAGNAALRSIAPEQAFEIGPAETLASATTTDLGAVEAPQITISGTTTITGFGTVAAGVARYIRFSGALTLTHNGTSLILPGGANILTVAGDTALAISEGSGNWRVLSYNRVSGEPLVGSAKGLQEVYVDARGLKKRTTNGPADDALETATNKVMLDGLGFDATAIEYAQFRYAMPKQWDRGTITAEFYWRHLATTTNFKVSWGIQAIAMSDDDAGEAAFGTAVYANDTGGTTADVYISPTTSAMTVGGSPAVEDLVTFQVLRKADDGTNDTLAVDAILLGVKLFINTTTGNDA